MAKTRSTSNAGVGGKARSAAERAALIESVDVAIAHAPAVDASATIKAAFKDDAKMRSTFAENYRDRSTEAISIAKRTAKAFKEFKPTLFAARDKEPRTYLAPGENLASTLDRLVKEGVKDRRDRSNGRPLKVRLTPDIKALVQKNGRDAESLVLSDLIDILTLKLPGTPALRDEPAFTTCAAEKEAQERIDQIEGKAPAKPPATPPEQQSAERDSEPKVIKDFVAKHVHNLMALMPSPEEQPILVPSRRDELAVVRKSIDTLELRSGPSDVTSYHDFNSLQVAFEHVWAEVFDTSIAEVGRDLYQTYIELVDFTGYNVDTVTSVTSLEDIANLMTRATELGRATDNATPSNPVSKELTDAFNTLRANTISVLFSTIRNMQVATQIVDTLLGPLLSQIQKLGQTTSASTKLSNALPSVTRLTTLLTKLDAILKQKYAFTVFQPYSSNFGIMVTYRQRWEPEQYQVGELVSTIPLAPREMRRYTTRQVTKKSRTRKEIENNLRSNKTDTDSTARADREIVSRAENRTNFKVTADGSFGTDANKIHATAEGGGDTAKISQDTKKNFHEAVLKSAQEYKQDNRMEVETTSSEETETTTFHEIQNPNDELTVTYLFYELQRTYRISEKIHHLTPVVLMANEVPAPNAIDDAWLVKYDWILRRVLLDDSFRPALEYLTKSFVGDELNLQILDSNARTQRQVVDAIRAQVATQLGLVAAAERDLSTKMDTKGGLEFAEGILGTVKRVFDPLQLTGQSVTGTKEGMDTVADYAQQTLDRAEREKARLLDQLSAANSALQVAIDKLGAAIREHYDRVTEIDRLRVHVKENILYYMQAIWNHEPPDQRYFRVFNKKVPVIELKSTNVAVPLKHGAAIEDTFSGNKTLEAAMPFPDFEIKWKQMVEIADLDDVLGYKGNYAIYRLKQNNYLTLHMMQDYLELSDEIKLRDPDDTANYTVDDLQALATCLYRQNKTTYNKHKDEIRKMIIDRLTSGRAEDDRVIVPTKSLFIEALVGTHPLLEDFKLLHRAIDVKKAQGEVRHVELENVRLAARALKDKLEDPDIDKKILVVGKNASVKVDTDV